MAASTTADSVGFQETKKSLSQRVINAGLAGPRAFKRFLVKHKKVFTWVLFVLTTVCTALWFGWLVLSFYQWLLMFNPILFWLSIAVASLGTLYIFVLFYQVMHPQPLDVSVEAASSPPEEVIVVPPPAEDKKPQRNRRVQTRIIPEAAGGPAS